MNTTGVLDYNPSTEISDGVRSYGVGLGASELSGQAGQAGQIAYDENGQLLTGDWAGSIGDTGNAIDNLLSSDNFRNGRVPDIGVISNVRVVNQDEPVIRSDNQETAVKGIVDETPLSKIFFSDENIDALQQTLRYRVWQRTQYKVDRQSLQELYIIMRSTLLQHANLAVTGDKLLDEIRGLNALVLDYAVGEVSSNVQQYDQYIQDIHTLPQPFDRPLYSGGSNNNTYDLSNFVGI